MSIPIGKYPLTYLTELEIRKYHPRICERPERNPRYIPDDEDDDASEHTADTNSQLEADDDDMEYDAFYDPEFHMFWDESIFDPEDDHSEELDECQYEHDLP
jgi:hypothetical protein